MKLIRLSDGTYIASNQIVEVKMNAYGNSINVRTLGGATHAHKASTVGEMNDELYRLVEEINEANK